MRVFIDQDLCTGDGLCVDLAPAVFVLLEDGIAYVKEGDKVGNDPGGVESTVRVPEGLEEAVISAATVCPGECIYIEPD
jgi:ferredoxin